MDTDLATGLERRRRQSSRYPIAIEKNSGIALCYDPDLIAPRILKSIAEGQYEAAEVQQALDVIQSGDAVLELGAGLGFVSTIVCRRCEVASFLAVEANPRLIPLIRETHRINGIHGVDLLNAIVTSNVEQLRSGHLGFHFEPEFWAGRVARPGETVDVSVDTVPLAQILANRRISVIIADIEGGEADLLDGVDLTAVRHVVMELHPYFLDSQRVGSLIIHLHQQGLIYDTRRSHRQFLTLSRDVSAARRSAT